MANNPWTNPTHPTAIAAMNKSHQRVYLPVTQNAQQPPASNNPWAYYQPPAQAWAPYPGCYPMVIPTVVPAVVPCGSPSMQYPGSSPISPSVQFYSAQVQSPVGANYYQGPTTSQVNANNQARAHNVGAYNPDIQMVPQPASPDSEFWCRELNGHYTLRTMNTIMQSLQPGVWARGSSGYPYFVRHAKS